MKYTIGIAVSLLGLSVSHAAVTCTETECQAETMPLLNQMESSVQAKFGSMACLPTASTMVMEAVFSDKKDVVSGSFTQSVYQQSSYGAVLLMGQDMKTTSQNGTYVSDANKTFQRLAAGFSAQAEALYVENSTKAIEPAMILAEMQNRGLGSILFASYIPSCSAMASGRQTCSFKRSYGHAVAVQGASSSKISIFDPGGNDKWSSSLSKLSADASYSNATLSLASLFKNDSARVIAKNYYDQGEVDLAEYYFGIRVPASASSSAPASSTPPATTTPVVSAPVTTPAAPAAPVVSAPVTSPASPAPAVTQNPNQNNWKDWANYFKKKGKIASNRR